LKIDDVAVQSKEVALEAGDSEGLTFVITAITPGTYTVSIDRLSGQLTVTPAQPVAPPASQPAPPVSQPSEPINWPLVGGVLAAFAVLAIVLWRVLRHRRA
jgi:hypothetical protein